MDGCHEEREIMLKENDWRQIKTDKKPQRQRKKSMITKN